MAREGLSLFLSIFAVGGHEIGDSKQATHVDLHKRTKKNAMHVQRVFRKALFFV